MPIPKTRSELTDLVVTSFAKLQGELEKAGPEAAALPCVDDWTVKDVLAVRAWWTESVVAWIEAGRGEASPLIPAPGYTWSETPRLNATVVQMAQTESYPAVCARLAGGYERVLATIDALDDRELLERGVFAWAGAWPVSRWISINTARQYTTARTYLRRALRAGRG